MAKKPKLSKAGINGLGALLSVGVLAGAYFLAISPIIDETSSREQELQTIENLTVSKTFNLQNLQQGAVDIGTAEDMVAQYDDIIATSVDIESAARAIASAENGSVTIESFSFGSPEGVTPGEAPEASLDGFSSPFSTGGGAVTEDTSGGDVGAVDPATGGVDETEFIEGDGSDAAAGGSSSGLQRVPVTIVVNASSQSALSEYANNLSQQSRLIFVTALESNIAEQTSATVYGYAYFEG